MHIAAEIKKDMDEQLMTLVLYHMFVRKMKLMYNDHVILFLWNKKKTHKAISDDATQISISDFGSKKAEECILPFSICNWLYDGNMLFQFGSGVSSSRWFSDKNWISNASAYY